MVKVVLLLAAGLLAHLAAAQSTSQPPLRIGVAGLVHGHVGWILRAMQRPGIEVVGIAEPNRALAQRYAKEYGFSMDLVYDDLATMLDKAKPQAVTSFNAIYDHLATVEACAPRGIHVMVEKPLAVSLEHARRMEQLAREHNIHLLTNYETTWYGSNHALYRMVRDEQAVGELRKVVVHDGHPGPKEIGVGEEFLEWLTDPKLNGGGALVDFGCYGANLMTWLMQGERPISVTAVTQQMKPDIYPKVEDEATIIVTYPRTQGIIQASWNWPIGRKDTEVYGQTGYVHALNATDLRLRLREADPESIQRAEDRPLPYNDPFTYLAAVVRGEIKVSPTDLSSLENNLMVVEILEAAKQSARTGKKVVLGPSQ